MKYASFLFWTALAFLASQNVAANPSVSSVKIASDLQLSITGMARFECTIGHNDEKRTFLFDKSSTATVLYSKAADAHFGVNNSRICFEMIKKLGDWSLRMPFVLTIDGNSHQSVREIYLAAENNAWGSFVFGDTRGVEQRLSEGPTDFLAGGGGIDNSVISKFFNCSTLVYMGPSLVGDTGYATKACYYTPSIAGLQVGVSLTPNTHHMGEGAMETASSPLNKLFSPFDTWSVGLGAAYTLKGPDTALRLSVVHLSGTTHPEKPNKPALERQDTNSWDFGAVLEVGSFRIGAEYLLNGRSGTALNPMLNIKPVVEGVTLPAKDYDPAIMDPYWALALGIGFVNDLGGITLSYFYTQRDTGICESGSGYCSQAKGQSLVLSLEYNLTPGISPYVEAGVYRTENPDFAYIGAGFSSAADLPFTAVPDNKAKAVLIGLKFKF